MAVSLRLKMLGSKHRPFYRIIAVDQRKTRDGKSLANLGLYSPIYEPAGIEIDEEGVLGFLNRGAQPTPTVKNLLRQKGIKQVQKSVDGKVTREWAKVA